MTTITAKTIKEFVEMIKKEQSIKSVKLVDDIDNALAGTLILDGYKHRFENFNGELRIEAHICYETIPRYYSYMSTSDKNKWRDSIHYHFNKRTPLSIEDLFDIDREDIDKNWEYECFQDGRVTKQSYFEVEDVLKPRDEYILEIKESEAYKAHIHSKFDYYYDSDENLTEFYINGSIIFDSEGCLDYDECLNAFLNHVSSLCVVDASANSKTEYKDTSKINMYKMPEVDTKKGKI